MAILVTGTAGFIGNEVALEKRGDFQEVSILLSGIKSIFSRPKFAPTTKLFT